MGAADTRQVLQEAAQGRGRLKWCFAGRREEERHSGRRHGVSFIITSEIWNGFGVAGAHVG